MKNLYTYDLAHLKDFVDFYCCSHKIILVGSFNCPFFLCYDELLILFKFSGVPDIRVLGYELFHCENNSRLFFYIDDFDMQQIVELYVFG